MPSPEMLAFNADARTRKAFVSSNYDPRAVRELMRAPPELERTSTFVDCGGYRIEHRGRAERTAGILQ